MSKHEVGFAHTNEIACKKQSRLCRGWFTAYTYGLKGLSAYERLYRDFMKAYTGKTARLYQENILV